MPTFSSKYSCKNFCLRIFRSPKYLWNIINLRGRVRFTFTNLCFKNHIRPVIILLVTLLATDLYNQIVSIKNKVNKSIRIKSVILIILIVLLSAVVLVPRFRYLPGINVFYEAGESIVNKSTGKSIIPTINENAVTNEQEGVYSYQIRIHLLL